MTRRGARGWRGRMRVAAALAAGWCAGVGGAWADAVRIDGFWYDNAEIVGFEDGRVLYEVAGASREAELSRFEGVRIVGIDAVERGDRALAEGAGEDAARLYERARRDVRRPWARTYLDWRSMQAHAAAGDARAAATAWLALAREGADPFFLVEPPVDAVRAADAPTKRWLAGELDRLRRPPAAVAEAAETLREAARLDAAAAEAAAPPDAGLAAPAVELVLPSAIQADDPVARLIAAGDFDAAAEAARARLTSSGGLAKNLYLLGRAQLARAEATGEESAYLDAGLSFMKAAIYFPRGRYAGFALAEAGRVHDAIGRSDKADELYRRAALLIDEQSEPDYAQRLTQFQEAPGG